MNIFASMKLFFYKFKKIINQNDEMFKWGGV